MKHTSSTLLAHHKSAPAIPSITLQDILDRTKQNILASLEEHQVLIPQASAKKIEVNTALSKILFVFSENVLDKLEEFNKQMQQSHHEEKTGPIKKIASNTSTFGMSQLKQLHSSAGEILKLRDQVKQSQELQHYYEDRLRENGETIRKTNIQMDFLKGQLTRREVELAKLRERFYKEVLILKEQVCFVIFSVLHF